MSFSPPDKKKTNSIQASDLESLMKLSKKTGESMQEVVDRFRRMSATERRELLTDEKQTPVSESTLKKQEPEHEYKGSVFYSSTPPKPIPRKPLPKKESKGLVVNLWKKRESK